LLFACLSFCPWFGIFFFFNFHGFGSSFIVHFLLSCCRPRVRYLGFLCPWFASFYNVVNGSLFMFIVCFHVKLFVSCSRLFFFFLFYVFSFLLCCSLLVPCFVLHCLRSGFLIHCFAVLFFCILFFLFCGILCLFLLLSTFCCHIFFSFQGYFLGLFIPSYYCVSICLLSLPASCLCGLTAHYACCLPVFNGSLPSHYTSSQSFTDGATRRGFHPTGKTAIYLYQDFLNTVPILFKMLMLQKYF
jgi:hypothetical protein